MFGSLAADRWLSCTGLLSIMSPEYSPADLGNVVSLPLNRSLRAVSTKCPSISTAGQILIQSSPCVFMCLSQWCHGA